MELQIICVEPSITRLQVSIAGGSHVGNIFSTTPNFWSSAVIKIISKLYWKITVISHSIYITPSIHWGEVQPVIHLFFSVLSP